MSKEEQRMIRMNDGKLYDIDEVRKAQSEINPPYYMSLVDSNSVCDWSDYVHPTAEGLEKTAKEFKTLLGWE